jgi:acyl-coenzyme A thioesterase PaaI-like protein
MVEPDELSQHLCSGCHHAGLMRCRLGLTLETTPEREIRGRIVFSPDWAGANGAAHGGFVAAVFDEMFGVACAANGGWSVTASLTVSYRLPVPIDVAMVVHAWQEEHNGRKRVVRGDLRRADDDQLVADAHALFIDMRARPAQEAARDAMRTALRERDSDERA